MIIHFFLREWRWLVPLVPPALRQWAEGTVRALFDSPQPAPVLRQQLERDVRQRSQAIVSDPSLTVEDKVALMMTLIVKKMDDDIEKQAAAVQSLSSIAQRPAAMPRPRVPSGTIAPTPTKSGAPSIDVETLKLKRMIDKRSQMFDLFRQITERYNHAARSVIEAMR